MVNIQPTTKQSVSDDQDLAKVLAGVSQQADSTAQFDQAPSALPTPTAPSTEQPAADNPVAYQPEPAASTNIPVGAEDDLTPIKNEAINELRPLVDKLDLPPEEKFDTYLLLLRSTDDRTLIAPAHAAAQAITDESKKAQALLDIIKEIDFLSQPPQ